MTKKPEKLAQYPATPDECMFGDITREELQEDLKDHFERTKSTIDLPTGIGKTKPQITEEKIFPNSRNENVHGFNCRYNNYNRLLFVNGERVSTVIDHGEEAPTSYKVHRETIEKLGLSLKSKIDLNDKVLGFVLEGTQGFRDWRGFGSDEVPNKFYVVLTSSHS